MLFQVYLTVIVAILLVAAVVWAVIRKPFLNRWRYENRVEEHNRKKVEEERVARSAAEQECETWFGDSQAQEEPSQQEVREK
jgi:hypothetical protein